MFKNNNKGKFTHLFHFAFRKGLKKMTINKYINDNVLMTKKLVQFSNKNNIQFIFPSTPAYFPNDKSHKENDFFYSYNLYSFTKILCENLITNEKNLNYIVFRIFNVYGNGGTSFLDNLKLKIIAKNKYKFNENNWISRDFISIEDLFNIFEILVIKTIKKNTFNLACGKSYQLGKIVNKIDKSKLIKFSNNVKFTPYRPVVKADISKLIKSFKFTPNKNIYNYFSE
tara:strand:+ start:284 stop:964 length:681 start_codon:yes stop_codon:yes gene_type:complete